MAATDSPRGQRWLLLYDSDCGFCKWLLVGLLRLDREGRLRPIPLQGPEADEPLADLSLEGRMESFHLVSPAGARLSGGEALATLLRLLRWGRRPAALLERFPAVAVSGYRWVAVHRVGLSRFVPRRAKARASRRLRERSS